MSERTPGEWRVNVWTNGRVSISSGAPGREIAEVWPSLNERQQRANADLIAAAPDLLAACEIALRRLNEQNGQVREEVWNANYPADKALRDAIKKSKGV